MFISLNIYSQNNLSSLFNIKDFPKNMVNVKSFIEKSTDPYMITNLIFGGTKPSNSNFQFTIDSNKNLQFELPNSNGISLTFFDYKSKLPVKSHRFYVDYQFLYLNYYNDFNLNEETFSDEKCFDLAYQMNTENNENPLSHFYLNLIKKFPDDQRFSLMLDEIYKNYKIKKPKKTNEIFNEENLSFEEKLDLVADYLSSEIDAELSVILFKTFIQNKDKKKTWDNIEKVYGKDIKTSLDEIFAQKITINTNQEAKLNIPDKFLSFTKENEFIATNIECKLDLKNLKLSITFKSTQPLEMTIKNALKLSNKKVVQSEKIESNEVCLIISETGKELIVVNKYTKENYKIEEFK